MMHHLADLLAEFAVQIGNKRVDRVLIQLLYLLSRFEKFAQKMVDGHR